MVSGMSRTRTLLSVAVGLLLSASVVMGQDDVEVLDGPVPAEGNIQPIRPPVPADTPATTPATPPATAPAETPEAPPAPTGTVRDPQEVRLYLMDGSVIAGKLKDKSLLVHTEFGDLQIPIGRIRSFTPGLDSHSDYKQKLHDLIENLGSSKYAEREQAQKDLTAMGPSIRRELERAKTGNEGEKNLRIKAILDTFEELAADDDEESDQPGELIRADSIETAQFTLVGEIDAKSFQVQSPYGELTVKLGDIRQVQRTVNQRNEERKTFAVSGTDNVFKEFKSCGLQVERGDQVIIKASGQITMSPWGSNAVSTPEGTPNYGWWKEGSIPVGALVYRIGKSGEPVKTGSQYSFTADKPGVIYFAMAMHPSYANYSFPGQYRVTVTVKPKER
ncbi:MAG: hypothetical protein BIFFINMI_02765 [Phycisphaerae bacterium]|nr:hypothetical protein [Phycisphaerae bacterium]